ncbi:MAG: hypothetical protein U1A24_10220 [Cypionkella sp.]|uniref:hypothetical protein n=1 Tax=Cypionkella sp. TaxID=2811411 RepID=UPI002ABA3D11|nr:hypothetical protein [Cypionkella sp.]MDZ4310913.1 hypothetical protein [Cypionkella sp.]
MSAPNTNIEKQARRHRGPLIGMALAAVFGVGLIVFWLFEESSQSDPPAPQDPQGQVQEAPTSAAPVTPAPGEGAIIPQGGEVPAPATPAQPAP